MKMRYTYFGWHVQIYLASGIQHAVTIGYPQNPNFVLYRGTHYPQSIASILSFILYKFQVKEVNRLRQKDSRLAIEVLLSFWLIFPGIQYLCLAAA